MKIVRNFEAESQECRSDVICENKGGTWLGFGVISSRAIEELFWRIFLDRRRTP